MRGGSLRRQVVIEQFGSSQNAIGEMTGSWSTFATTWARIEPKVPGTETIVAQQINAMNKVEITIRWLAGVTARMRVKYGTRIFMIQAVANVGERNAELTLSCVEQL